MRRTLLHGFALITVMVGAFAARPAQVSSTSSQPAGDPVQQGKYLVNIAGCVTCHTPFQAKYSDPSKLTLAELRTLSLAEHDALDTARLLAGGRVFDLGPGGSITSPNLTPDVEAGLGAWSDEEIKAAIRAGVSRDGRQLHPLMPYAIYNNLAETDLDAIVAYLRSLSPINNQVADGPSFPMPPLPVRTGITAPAPTDTAARGKYLMNGVLPCAHCHTSVDSATGQPDPNRYLAGGQPYEGPWGIVYAANLTPDQTTGLGAWSDAEIKRVLTQGIEREGRHLVLMPWRDYALLTPQDVNAVVYYLRHDVPAVKNEVPAEALKPEFVDRVSVTPPAAPINTSLLLGAVAVLSILLAGAGVLWRRRRVATP